VTVNFDLRPLTLTFDIDQAW